MEKESKETLVQTASAPQQLTREQRLALLNEKKFDVFSNMDIWARSGFFLAIALAANEIMNGQYVSAIFFMVLALLLLGYKLTAQPGAIVKIVRNHYDCINGTTVDSLSKTQLFDPLANMDICVFVCYVVILVVSVYLFSARSYCLSALLVVIAIVLFFAELVLPVGPLINSLRERQFKYSNIMLTQRGRR